MFLFAGEMVGLHSRAQPSAERQHSAGVGAQGPGRPEEKLRGLPGAGWKERSPTPPGPAPRAPVQAGRGPRSVRALRSAPPGPERAPARPGCAGAACALAAVFRPTQNRNLRVGLGPGDCQFCAPQSFPHPHIHSVENLGKQTAVLF